MRTITQVNIKNLQNNFFNDMTNINDFDPSLLNVDSIEFRSRNSIINDIRYIKNLNSSNSFDLVFNNLDGNIEKTSDKYLIFASTNKNGMMLGDYAELWDEIEEHIELISGNKVIKYSRDFDFMKIKFKSDDDLPLGKIINISVYNNCKKVFLKKIVNIIHKFYYTNVFMSMKKLWILQLCKVSITVGESFPFF